MCAMSQRLVFVSHPDSKSVGPDPSTLVDDVLDDDSQVGDDPNVHWVDKTRN